MRGNFDPPTQVTINCNEWVVATGKFLLYVQALPHTQPYILPYTAAAAHTTTYSPSSCTVYPISPVSGPVHVVYLYMCEMMGATDPVQQGSTSTLSDMRETDIVVLHVQLCVNATLQMNRSASNSDAQTKTPQERAILWNLLMISVTVRNRLSNSCLDYCNTHWTAQCSGKIVKTFHACYSWKRKVIAILAQEWCLNWNLAYVQPFTAFSLSDSHRLKYLSN